MHESPRPAPRAAGFTLVELLVALVIVSVGLLGIAKLSLGTVQANDSAFMRSQASALVQQILDDMRANQPEAKAGGYDVAIGSTPSMQSCLATSCSAGQVAAADLYTWKSALQANLPSGDGSVVTATTTNPTTGAPETTATITVQWDDSVAQWSFGTAAAVTPAPVSVTVETLL